jgi:DNA repair exonuclease SbcCD nuclease subunit
MIKCIIHCSDIHIRNFQRLNEYAEQLTNFVEKCKEIAKDYERDEIRIVICGDLVHQKNNISNELMTFSSFFLRQLEEIAKVIVVAGNHDLLVNNMSRTDTLTALFDTANFDDCMFIDSVLGFESGFVEDDNVVWALYSIYSGYAPPSFADLNAEGKQIIGLYHGMVVGAKLNNGTIVDGGAEGSLFDGCTCVMAGDIHKRQVIKYNDIEIVYPGSLIQQTFGETVSQHGFVVWDVENMSHKFVDLESEYGLYDIEIESLDDLDEDKERLINF